MSSLARYTITTAPTKVVLARGFINHVGGEPVRLFDSSSQSSTTHFSELFPGDQVIWDSEGEEYLYAATQSNTATLEFTPSHMKVVRNGMGNPRSATGEDWTVAVGAGILTRSGDVVTYTEDGVPAGIPAMTRAVPTGRTWELMAEGFFTYDNAAAETVILEVLDANGVARFERLNESISSAATVFLHETDTASTNIYAREGETLQVRYVSEVAAGSVTTFNIGIIERYGTLIP